MYVIRVLRHVYRGGSVFVKSVGVLKLSIYAEGYFVSPELLQNQANFTSEKKLSAKQLI